MTLEVILGVLVIVGTIAGTYLGYALSMRGKTKVWEKEYRAKRLSPLIDYVNEYMGIACENIVATSSKDKLQQQLAQTTDDGQRKVILKALIKTEEDLTQMHNRLSELLGRKSWLGLFSPMTLDKQLNALCNQWLKEHNFDEQPTTKNLKKGILVARQILDRADELIIKG